MLDLSTLTTEQQVAALYIGYYDRAAEPQGFTFWNNVIGNTQLDLGGVADDFATQQETLDAYPFLGDPTEAEANAFITEVYLNLFNREPDGPDSLTQEQIDAGEVDGLTFWSGVLQGAIAGTNDFSVGQIILAIIEGAQGDDIVTITNKIEVANAWTAGAEDLGLGDVPFAELSDSQQASAKSIIAPVTDAQATVDAAKAEIAVFFAPEPVEGNTIFLTSSTDVVGQEGLPATTAADTTDDDDSIFGFIGQNGFTGGVSNTLSSGDRLDGQGGTDTLFAELSQEFVGATSGATTIDVQPKLNNIEIVELEARDLGTNTGPTVTGSTTDVDLDIDLSAVLPAIDFIFGDLIDDITDAFSLTLNEDLEIEGGSATAVAIFDGKDSFGIDEIGSVDSDGDLVIENLNTLALEDDAVGRKTADMTILMDHTDNFNSDGDAADLTVYFDENYLLANDPVQAGAQLTIELMDLDAETLGEDPLLDNPFGAITFTFGDELKELNYGTESNTYAELLADIQDAIDLAAQTDPDFSQLSASFGPIFTVRDTDEDPNPARPPLDGTTIVITNSGPEVLEAVSMIATGTQPAGKDFHTGFDNEAPEEENFKIEVDIDLHKVGRGGEGGNLVVGGKDQEIGQGIHVFNVDVLGAGDSDDSSVAPKPSNLGTLTSTNGDLETINIETHADFVDGDSWASLTIRDGFNHVDANGETGDLMMVNANDFLGDLTLGTGEAIINLDMLSALGGGDVTFVGLLDGEETNEQYVYLTGAGEDTVSVTVRGDALDYAESGLEIKTGDNADTIIVDLAIVNGGPNDFTNEQLNQAILDNVDIDGEGGDDEINVDGIGNANIDGSAGDDIIYTDGDGGNTVWALNFDAERAAFNGLVGVDPDDLPGVETSLAYLDGAKVTVTLSGAGVGNLLDGGGVMAFDLAKEDVDGYEASFTITDLINGNDYYGDQRDVNAAVIAAIEGDDVLNALLSVSIAANNTLVITSKTSGNFIYDDLRIDIEHGEATDSAYANAVLDEARELFSNSALTLTDLWGTTTFADPASYQTDDGDAPGTLFSDSAAADAWYDGLSVDGDGTEFSNDSMLNNVHTFGFASSDETDNVINGGDDDDIIVLSTDAFGNFVPPYLDGGNNAMINGASNETVVMEGDDFGDDTVMNFTAANSFVTLVGEPAPQDVGLVSAFDAGEDGSDAVPAQLILDVTVLVDQTGDTTVTIFDQTVVIPAGSNEAAVTTALTGLTYAGGFVAAVDPVDTNLVVYTNPTDALTEGVNPALAFSQPAILPSFVTQEDAVAAQTVDPASFTVSFVDEDAGDLTVPGADTSITVLGQPYTISDLDTAITEIAPDVASGTFPGPSAGQSWIPTDNGDGTVTFVFQDTVDTNNAGALPDFTDPTLFDFGIEGEVDIEEEVIADGLDFLDFTSYLTSQFDSSSNPPGTDDPVSNVDIPVTLNFNVDNDLAAGSGDGSGTEEVEANEVAVVRITRDSDDSESWRNLSEENVEDLFNNGGSFTGFGGDASYGDLNAGDFDVATYDKTDQEELIGDGKAIFMVENAGNLGEYKVFELTWDGDQTEDDGDVVSAKEIGTLDFGTSLLGLDDVNLVGSDDYAFLNDVGILNYV